jgi:hypothetical protein
VKRRTWLLGCLGLAAAGLLGGSVLMVGLARRIGPVETQVAANRAPVLVLLEQPVDGATYPLDSQIGVGARVFTEFPLASLQLWADGELVQAETPVGGQLTEFSQAWAWTPGSRGPHSLVARALDMQGHFGTSNVVTIHAGPPATTDLLIEAEQGDTLASIAGDRGVSLQDASAENPDTDPAAPLAAGDQVLLPIGPLNSAPQAAPPAPAAPPPTSGGPEPGPNPILFWLRSHLAAGGATALPPAAPDLQVSVKGCDAELTIEDGASDAVGLFVYLADSGSTIFSRVQTLGPSALQTTTDTDLTASADYYVSAFNAVGETPSDIAHAAVSTSDCAPPTPEGVFLADGLLHVPDPLPIAYLYMSVDGGPWFRVPSDPRGFMKPDGNGAFPLGTYLPAGTDPTGWQTLAGRVWGWQGGQLVHVGDFDQSAPAEQRVTAAVGNIKIPSKLGICITLQCSGDFAQYTKSASTDRLGDWSFRWSPQESAITGAVYQVSDRPFVAACSLEPSQLLMTGPVPGTPEPGQPLYFKVDLSQLTASVQLKPPSAVGAQLTPGGLSATRGLGAGGLQPETRKTGPAGLPGLLGNMWLSPTVQASGAASDGTPISQPFYYVRVLPRVNNQILCDPTNSVQLKLNPPSEPLGPIDTGQAQYQVNKIDFSPPWSAGDHFGCFKLTQDFGPYRKGDTVCPAPYKGGNPPWYKQLFGFVVDAVNWISKAYQDLQNTVVNFVADLVPDPPGCGSGCKSLLKAGLKAGLAAMGLPPSLPNFDQLVELGKGSLTDAIADYASDATGIPCDDTEFPGTNTSCKGAIRDGIDAMVNEVRKATASASCGMSEAEAHAHGIEGGVCLPPEVAKAVPSGIQPATVKVTVQRILDDSEHWPNGCELDLQFDAVNEQAVGEEVVLPSAPIGVPITGPLNGSLFQPMSMGLPNIKVGETATIPFVLQPNMSYLVPGYLQTMGQQVPDQSDYAANWSEFYRGAVMTIDAGGNVDSTTQLPCVQGDHIDVGPLPWITGK